MFSDAFQNLGVILWTVANKFRDIKTVPVLGHFVRKIAQEKTHGQFKLSIVLADKKDTVSIIYTARVCSAALSIHVILNVS